VGGPAAGGGGIISHHTQVASWHTIQPGEKRNSGGERGDNYDR
jgi:hypothetical protein